MGAANAHHGAGKLFPGIAAADAVCREAHRALERLEGRFGIVAENAVQRAGRVPKRIQPVLQNEHIGAAGIAAHGGVAYARAGRGAIAAVEVHPAGRHADGLYIAPGLGSHSGVADAHALGAGHILPHVKRDARVVLAGGAVPALPDALKGIADINALAVAAAREIPGFHGGYRCPKRLAAR